MSEICGTVSAEVGTIRRVHRRAWALRRGGMLVGLAVAAATLIGASALDAAAGSPAAAETTRETGGYPHAVMPCAHPPYKPTGKCPGYDWGPVRDTARGYSVTTTFSREFGYGYRNCTDWAAWRLAQLGVPVATLKGLGNGGQWAAKAIGRVVVNTTPAVGAAAVQVGNPGHVAVVEAMNGDRIRVSEYNQRGDGTYADSRSGTPAQLGFQRFVHFEAYEAVSRSEAMNKVVSVSENGSSYFYDGVLHWIPDVETYHCLVGRGKQVLRVSRQNQVDSLGSGKPWVSQCFAPARVIEHVVREQGGAAYYVTAAWPTVWHWIPDGATYDCLVAQGHSVIQSNWTQINSLRGARGEQEGAHAVCGQSLQVQNLAVCPWTDTHLDWPDARTGENGYACNRDWSSSAFSAGNSLICSVELLGGSGQTIGLRLLRDGQQLLATPNSYRLTAEWHHRLYYTVRPAVPNGSYVCEVLVDGVTVASRPFMVG